MFVTVFRRCCHFCKRSLILVSWISLVSYLFYETFICYKEEKKFNYLRRILGFGLCIARGSATIINICCALVLLPLCKKLNQVLYKLLAKLWPGLFFYWLETAKSFHMTVAITLFIFAVIHSISHFVNLWNFSRNYDESHPDVNLAAYKGENPLRLLLTQPGLTGLSMLVITTTMCVTSSRVVRRKCYNAFWYTHRMYLLFIILLVIHPLSGALKEEVLDGNEPKINSSQISDRDSYYTPIFVPIQSKTWLWMAIPLACFFIDLIWRIVVRNRSDCEIIKMTAMGGRVLSLTLSCPQDNFSCRPGQYVLLQCLDISLLEWHPFTVVKVPTATERNFVVWIKVVGDWTEFLECLLITKSLKTRILVDGPMPSPMERVGRSKLALCVGAGVGITPFVPFLYDMLSEPLKNTPGRVHLIWIVRTESEAAALGDLATRCLRQLREYNRPDRLHLTIYITGSINHVIQTMVNEKGETYAVKGENDGEVGLLSLDSIKDVEDNEKNHNIEKEYPLLACRIKRGRPHWDQVFGDWVHLYPRDHLTLFCCGPKNLVKILRKKCHQVCLSNTKTKITFVYERFS